MFQSLRNIANKPWLRRLGSDRLLRGFGMFGLGEGVNRVTRILTTIILARQLGPLEFGIAATALTCFEVVRVLAQNGLGQLIIKAPRDELRQTCNTAYRILIAACVVMFVVQVSAGAALAWLAGRPELFWMIFALSFVYAVMPGSMVHYWLLQRNYRVGVIAGVTTAQNGTDNLLTAALALSGLGAWAIVLPKLLTAPIWLFGMRRAIRWHYRPERGFRPLGPCLRFCLPILASEGLLALRSHADNMLVGSILGLEALGIYYFAYNAGYGLSMVLTSALQQVAFPHLADVRLGMDRLIERFDKAMTRLALPITAIIIAQAAAVPIYVPLLFGDKWNGVISIVAVLCLSAATRPWFDLGTQLLRAAGLQGREFVASALFTVVLLSAFAVALPYGLHWGVSVLCGCSVAMQAMFAAWAREQAGRHIRSQSNDRVRGRMTPAGEIAA